MHKTEILSTKRSRKHNYSKPGTYHLCFETRGGEEVLGTLRKGMMRLNAFGELLLTALALALHRFGGVHVLAMDIRPRMVEMVVVLSGWRLKLRQVIDRLNSLKITDPARRWLRFRRTQTIPLFAGYVKTHSARRINEMRGSRAAVWKRRYKVAVLTDEEAIRRLCADLDARYATIRFPVQQGSDLGPLRTLYPAISSVVGGEARSGLSDAVLLRAPEHARDTLLLGRALFLMGRLSDAELARAENGPVVRDLQTKASGVCVQGIRIRSIEMEGSDSSADSVGR